MQKSGEAVKITDAIFDEGAITRILTSLNLPTEIPKFYPPVRAPPDEDVAQFDLSWA